jgi:hypothetical protein
MRRTFNANFIYQNDQFVGVDLGSYQHEGGCKGIQSAFGIDSESDDSKGFCATKSPELHQCTLSVVKFKENGMEWAGIYFDGRRPYERSMTTKDRVPKPIVYEEDEICSAWDENEFGIVVNKKYAWMIDDLLMAIVHGDLIVEVDGSDSTQSGGLRLLIKSRVLSEIIV